MRLLVDASLPATLEVEAPPGFEITRWTGTAIPDEDLLRVGAAEGYRAVILLDRAALAQPHLRDLAIELGIALVAVDATGPIEGKARVLNNLNRLRVVLAHSEVALILASEVRPAVFE